MSVFVVSYDLNKIGQNYQGLIARIKMYPHWQMQKSAWILVTGHTAAQIRDHLAAVMDANDTLIVASITTAAWHGFEPASGKWLKDQIEAVPA